MKILALALFMFLGFANDEDTAFASDRFTLGTDFFH